MHEIYDRKRVSSKLKNKDNIDHIQRNSKHVFGDSVALELFMCFKSIRRSIDNIFQTTVNLTYSDVILTIAILSSV